MDSSAKYPADILEDVLVKVGDFCVLNEVVVLDIVKDACTLIVLGRPFLATAGCNIDVKVGS